MLYSPLQKADEQEIPEVTYLPCKRHSRNAKIPIKGSKDSAGYDLYTLEGKIVPAHGQILIPTNISIELPKGTYGWITPRSGLALKHQINIHAGVIDANYRGTLGIILFNHSSNDFIVTLGDRIAQLIVEKIDNPIIIEVEHLPQTE